MKHRIEIKSPCSENWEKMSSTEQGRFCQSCKKEVTDFTQLSNHQIITKLQSNIGNNCGRFKKTQLVKPIELDKKRNFTWSLGISALLTSITPVIGQNNTEPIVTVEEVNETNLASSKYILSGIVTDSEGYPLPGVNLIVLDTDNGGATDFDGLFTIEFDMEFKGTIRVNYMGYKPYDFEVNQNTKYVTIAMEEDPAVLGEIVVVGGYNYCPERQTLFTAIRRLYHRIFY